MTKQPAINLLGDLNAATRSLFTGAEIKGLRIVHAGENKLTDARQSAGIARLQSPYLDLGVTAWNVPIEAWLVEDHMRIQYGIEDAWLLTWKSRQKPGLSRPFGEPEVAHG